MNILAIDYGKKRLGLAWCDTAVGVVLPYGIIDVGKLGNNEIGKLVTLIHEERIQKVIIGLPLGLDGKENENTKRVREFGNELGTKAAIPVEYIDERFTSRLADTMGGDATRDEKAAMGILQSYMQRSQ